MIRRPPRSTPLPYTTLSRSNPATSSVPLTPTAQKNPGCQSVSVCSDTRKQHPTFTRMNGPQSCVSVRVRSEEHTSELQSRQYLVCRLLLENKKIKPLNSSHA